MHCTVAPDNEVLVTRLAAPLQGVRRLDVARETSFAPGEWERVEDVPFDPEAGELVWMANIARIRELPEHTLRVKLLAVEGDDARQLGTYTFRHRPWRGGSGAGGGRLSEAGHQRHSEFDARSDKRVLRVSRRHHGNVKGSVITQDFMHGTNYASLAEAATTFRGLLHEGSRVVSGKGEKLKEERELPAML